MSYIPKDLVKAGIERAKQGDRQFNNTQIGCQVAAVFGNGTDNDFPDFLGQRFTLVVRESFDILRSEERRVG